MKACETCHGGCCRRFFPDITGYDILRIIKNLQLDVNFFATAQPVDPHYLRKALGVKPLFTFTDSGQKEYYRFCLKMEPSKQFPGSYRCMFLNELDNPKNETINFGQTPADKKSRKQAVARCGIYHARPLTCRTFPAKIHPEERTGLLIDPNRTFQKDKNPAYKLCPDTIKQDDCEGNQSELIDDLARYEYEMTFFLKLSEKWNQNPCISDNFMEFMKNEYKNRIKYIGDKEI